MHETTILEENETVIPSERDTNTHNLYKDELNKNNNLREIIEEKKEMIN